MCMIDLKLDANWDLELSAAGDISKTDSIVQAVRIRLLWFFKEWRLGPGHGVPYFEEILVKNPNEAKVRHLIREIVMSVERVTNVLGVGIAVDKKTRQATIAVSFATDEDTYKEEVKVKWHSTD